MSTNGSRVGEDGGSGIEAMSDRFGAQVASLRGYADSADQRVRSFARERPLAAVAIAVGVGFLLGRLASRT